MLKRLLSTPTAQLGKMGRFGVFQIKLWSHCARLLVKNRSGQQAAALAYHTVFGIVPLAILMLLIFQSFPAYSGVGDKVKGIVYEQLNLSNMEYAPDKDNPEEKVKLTDKIDDIVESFFEGLNEGRIAFFSLIIVIWAAVALLSTIERSFNNIWHVGKGRNFLNRVINYWALLTLSPLLIGIGIYIGGQYTIIGKLESQVNVAPVVISFLIATTAFFLLYFILPNTRVKAKSAIWGAAVAAVVWCLAKWGFSLYITKFIPYSEVYGVMGLIPLSVLWIFITWLIVLFGLHLTFTTQHLKSLDAAEIASARKTEDFFIANEITAINVVAEIGAAFEKNSFPVETEVISSKLNIPSELCEKLLDHLVVSGIIFKVSDPQVGFVLAKEPESIKLSDISNAIEPEGFGRFSAEHWPGLNQIEKMQNKILSDYTLKQILSPQPINEESS